MKRTDLTDEQYRRMIMPFEDDILLVDKVIFGDEDEHEITMLFEDGRAYDYDNKYVLCYPTMEDVLDSEDMQQEIKQYCGREVGGFFEIALKYGVLYQA